MATTVITKQSRGRLWATLGGTFLALLLLGVVTARSIRVQERHNISAGLQALLNANHRSITSWLDDRRSFMGVVVNPIRMRKLLQPLVVPGQKADPALLELLHRFASPFDLEHPMVVNRDGLFTFDVDGRLTGKPLPAELRPAFEKALAGQPCIVPPLILDVGKGPDSPTFLALAAIPAESGPPLGVLLLAIDPARFSDVLSKARAGESGEVYAFDRQGRMISESRFLDQIVAAGVLPAGTKSTVLTLDLRNPGVDIRTGMKSDVPRQAQPLTAMVASAVAGGSGINADGYVDYRGVPAVAAWEWIPQYDFGLAVKRDRDEAYAALNVLRLIFASLLALLAVASVVCVVYLHLSDLAKRRLERAQEQVESLGQYHLERKLGEGGMGTVYLGTHALLRRPTAIKVMRNEAAEEDRARFEREVHLACRLSHPNTIAIFDYGCTLEGRFYYAMEFLDGLDLSNLAEPDKTMPPGRIIHILQQVLGALGEAHRMKLIHRDIKPENIMLCTRGGIPDVVKVLDFGLVKSLTGDKKLTATSTICGTPAYMAPEMISESGHIDGRCDLYAVACVGYFLLTGRVLFDRSGVMAILTAHLQEEPAPPSVYNPAVPKDLEAVIMRNLQKQPGQRDPDAEHMRKALLACAAAGTWTEDDAAEWWGARNARTPATRGPGETLEAGAALKVEIH